jgi:hypothetical protein
MYTIATVGSTVPNKLRNVQGKRARTRQNPDPTESRASEVTTIAWTVSVTGVLIADLMVVAAHLYARSNPDAQPARLLETIMLLSASAMGIVSLVLLPLVWRTRRLKPPTGYIAFAIFVSAAPLLATLTRLVP